MLKSVTKQITITGQSIIEKKVEEQTIEVPVEGYSATIDSNNPEDMSISSWQIDKEMYKANRIQCRQDSADFEDAAYAIQDEMIAARKRT